MKSSPIKSIVQSSMCIGCGGCAGAKDQMGFNSEGLYQPHFSALEELDGKEKLCPFNPTPDESSKRASLNTNIESNKYHKYIGNYSSMYAGYSDSHRKTSSSGGVSTWILEQLLEQGLVDKIICVGSDDDGCYEYKIVNNVNDLVASSHTKYFPVTLNNVLNEVAESNDSYAIVGLPCFIHAIKLREKYDSKLKGKIKFKIGLFCGGYKTKFFTEYLSGLCGVDKTNIQLPQYRVKKKEGVAVDYLFSVLEKSSAKNKSVSMNNVGDMWGTGLFKPEVCDYCEDISAELADVSIGDAWIPPYLNSPLGNNVVICRNRSIEKIIKQGISNNTLSLDIINEEQILQSQRGNIAHRIKSLAYRLSKKEGVHDKRLMTKPKRSFNFINNIVQYQRGKVRRLSIYLWPQCHSSEEFDHKMKPHLKRLKILTKLNQIVRKITARLRT
ncbi:MULTISPECIES: Coenzyme F420 hydrogenase/dehydrogenase, beta subunit C-terminal domain [unclassified Colwellia]|uniref:Coenzyme F420 hydrogenase/dehydrogenase, beta subunit C-terminal domain n=1 Tax=unclassified Colwellia TaxID=196834 RepID=UPI0015F366CF|nr:MULTISPECIES: Coenzyme F420 hydrogenase/dehydrogenase, beta subunit C-terminal domain [unclassified Colwellia]MBA6381227.1 Coenzyme F420 hydrogenase/dehydrogenase, beta subunit C-terminal domain [Colwellia sp. BRX10-7]MBA6388922.1 Coenzyme F420 hydrogenase/dehydrogenase, beta subunit C-terminal domain [Colwellia sp. BRX10-2]MBA6400007.1 Coenzyme F420 hydrogenase/dehydrogenase, beta subunit C-terminal domain [Colwellia sp. BRX10-5]MBA6403886.1 Coenzyme F420 hydrogenase/dehydrogenase, beta sub